MKKLALIALLLAVTGLVLMVPALAEEPGFRLPRMGDFTVQASSEDGSAIFIPDPDLWTWEQWQNETTGKWYTSYYWESAEEISLMDGAIEIGVIEGISVTLDEDPAVAVDFVCRAGAKNTTFTYSNWLDTSLIIPDGQATAGITATDRTGNGVAITGLFDDNNCYQARYNSPVTVFQNMVPGGGVAPPNQTYISNGAYGWVPVGSAVTRMEAQFLFTLTARDSASGTSYYQMVDPIPEPSSMLALCGGLAGLAGMALRRRR